MSGSIRFRNVGHQWCDGCRCKELSFRRLSSSQRGRDQAFDSSLVSDDFNFMIRILRRQELFNSFINLCYVIFTERDIRAVDTGVEDNLFLYDSRRNNFYRIL